MMNIIRPSCTILHCMVRGVILKCAFNCRFCFNGKTQKRLKPSDGKLFDALPHFLDLYHNLKLICDTCQVLANGRFRKTANGEKPEPNS